MIPVVKGGEPKALTEAKRDIRTPRMLPSTIRRCRAKTNEKSLRLLLLSRAICARIACAELVPTIALQLSNI